MAWIESHQSVREHPKTRKAARILGVRPVHLLGHLHALWHWALDMAEDGDLSKFDAEDLAIAADWDGDPDEFVEALVTCGPGGSAGFLERDGACGNPEDDTRGDLVLHDWWEYAGKLIERRRRDRQRKADARADQSAGVPPDVRGKSEGSPADGPSDSRSRVTNQPTVDQPTGESTPDGAAVEPADQGPEFDDTVIELTRDLAQRIAANGFSLPSKGSKAAREWLVEMDRLIRLGPPGDTLVDPPPVEEIRKVAAWATTNEFWKANIRSVPKFREKWPQLVLQMARDGPRNGKSTVHADNYTAAAAALRAQGR